MSPQIKSKVEQSIRLEYESLESSYKYVQKEVLGLIKETCDNNQWLFTHRIKDVESYYLKITTGRFDGYLIDDFFACTIVVPSLKDIETAQQLISACFEVIETKPDNQIYSFPTEFNFDSIRNYCKLKRRVQPKVHDELIFEIQVKTLLEYAWSKATHDFSYKSDHVSWAKERVAAQIKAVLDNVDISIYEMESISKSPFLDKKNPKYERLNEIINFMNKDFADKIDNPLPKDLKRLSEQINRFLQRTSTSLETLKTYLDQETVAGRGYKIKNLSAYSIIISSVLQQNAKSVENGLSAKPFGKNPPKLVIPREVGIEDYIDVTNLQNVIILK